MNNFTIGFEQLSPDEQLTLMSFSPTHFELVLPEYVRVQSVSKVLISLRNKGLINTNKPPCKLTTKGIRIYTAQLLTQRAL